jgi:hypothetical protein
MLDTAQNNASYVAYWGVQKTYVLLLDRAHGTNLSDSVGNIFTIARAD